MNGAPLCCKRAIAARTFCAQATFVGGKTHTARRHDPRGASHQSERVAALVPIDRPASGSLLLLLHQVYLQHYPFAPTALSYCLTRRLWAPLSECGNLYQSAILRLALISASLTPSALDYKRMCCRQTPSSQSSVSNPAPTSS
jgi:hypothetical protein